MNISDYGQGILEVQEIRLILEDFIGLLDQSDQGLFSYSALSVQVIAQQLPIRFIQRFKLYGLHLLASGNMSSLSKGLRGGGGKSLTGLSLAGSYKSSIIIIIMSHKPERFEEFEEFSDHSGFLIREYGQELEFFFDKERGWFDEFGNYYRRDGQPAHPSRESLIFWDRIKNFYVEHQLNQLDDSDDEDPIQRQEMLKLQQTLSSYVDHLPIKIYFRGVRARCTEDQVRQFFGCQNVLEVVFDTRGKFRTGKGFIIVRNKSAARDVLLKHLEELDGQEVGLEIEAIDSEEDSLSLDSRAEELQFEEKHHTPQTPQKLPHNSQVCSPATMTPPPQQKPKPQLKTSYELVFSNVPSNESMQSFNEWLKKDHTQCWTLYQAKRDNKSQAFKVVFQQRRDAEEILNYFINNKQKLMFKGRNRLTVTKGV